MNFEKKRRGMVDLMRERYGFGDDGVLTAMQKVPRHEFVPKKYLNISYDDSPVDIGYGQTMSQPYTVAVMSSLVTKSNPSKSKDECYKKQKKGRVLEIGTGSGYQAAVLSYFFDRVYTTEIISRLARRAREVLKKLGYENVDVREKSGERGWNEKSPFDGIIVTAGVSEIPKELYQQLTIGGVMVAPIGRGKDKIMTRIVRIQKNKFKRETFGVFHFVPFIKE